MKRALMMVATASIALAGAAAAQAPREQSPAPRELLAGVGEGNSDAALDQAIAVAAASPLGTADNPIRVAGPEGERAYLARLRCADGKAPAIGAATPAGVGAYGTLVSSRALDCGAAAPGKIGLVVDLYHVEHPETVAPAGFSLAP